METKIPKVVEVEMLPNNRLLLNFDNGERRYLPSHFIEQYVGAFKLPNEENKGTKRTIIVSPATTFYGNKFEILEDGTVVMNEKDAYSPEELWENSVKHL